MIPPSTLAFCITVVSGTSSLSLGVALGCCPDVAVKSSLVPGVFRQP